MLKRATSDSTLPTATHVVRGGGGGASLSKMPTAKLAKTKAGDDQLIMTVTAREEREGQVTKQRKTQNTNILADQPEKGRRAPPSTVRWAPEGPRDNTRKAP